MMKTRQILQTIVATTIAVLALFVLPSASVFATGNQSNQAINRSALLVAPELHAQISIYLGPDTHNLRIGYGFSGDHVTVLEQVGSNEGDTWNHIQLKTPHLEGWVKQDSISFQENPSHSVLTRTPDQRRGNSNDYYLSNQQNNFYQSHQENQQAH